MNLNRGSYKKQIGKVWLGVQDNVQLRFSVKGVVVNGVVDISYSHHVKNPKPVHCILFKVCSGFQSLVFMFSSNCFNTPNDFILWLYNPIGLALYLTRLFLLFFFLSSNGLSLGLKKKESQEWLSLLLF